MAYGIKIFELPTDWETWPTEIDGDVLGEFEPSPYEHIPGMDLDEGERPPVRGKRDGWRVVRVVRHPMTGVVWYDDGEDFIDEDGDNHEGKWRVYTPPTEDRRAALARLEKALAPIRENIDLATDLAKEAGVAVSLEGMFRSSLANITPEGEAWYTSYC